MYSKEEFIELFNKADKETQRAIERILTEDQSPAEPQELPLNTVCTNK